MCRLSFSKSAGYPLAAGDRDPIFGVMQHLDLSDEEALALIKELAHITGNDRYPFSSRIQTLRAILAKLRPEPAPQPLAAAEGLCAAASNSRQQTAKRPAGGRPRPIEAIL